jgi:hypothetical protein
MYKSEYDSELRNETNFAKKLIFWVLGLLLLISLIGWGAGWFTKVVNPDTAISNYEEFQEIYNTCQQINTDLFTIRAVADSDRYFASFSKASMVAQKRQKMAYWVEQYNAKSKMWNRSLWKSSTLPYQLSVEQFPNYQ